MFLSFFLFYRILSHNKIRVLRNGSFFGFYALEKLWVAYCLSMNISLLQPLQCHVYCLHEIWRIHHVWAVILVCLRAFVENYRRSISEIWGTLSSSLSLSLYPIMGFCPTGRMIHSDRLSQSLVMMKSSHNYTSVLHYQVSPTRTGQDKGDLWEEVRAGSSLALLSSI